MMENKDAERDNGPKDSPGWICREAVGGICGIVFVDIDLTHHMYTAEKMRKGMNEWRMCFAVAGVFRERLGWPVVVVVVVVLTKGLS